MSRIRVSVDDYRRVKGQPTGEALVKLLQDSPLGEIKLDRLRTHSPIRDVDL